MVTSIIVVQTKSYKGIIIYFFDLQTSKVSGTVIWNGYRARNAWAAISRLIIVWTIVIIVAFIIVVDSAIVSIAILTLIATAILTLIATSQTAIDPSCLCSLISAQTVSKLCLIRPLALTIKFVIANVLLLIELFESTSDRIQGTQRLSIVNLINTSLKISVCQLV